MSDAPNKLSIEHKYKPEDLDDLIKGTLSGSNH